MLKRAVRIAVETAVAFGVVFALGLAIVVLVSMLAHAGVVLELADRSVGQ